MSRARRPRTPLAKLINRLGRERSDDGTVPLAFDPFLSLRRLAELVGLPDDADQAADREDGDDG